MPAFVVMVLPAISAQKNPEGLGGCMMWPFRLYELFVQVHVLPPSEGSIAAMGGRVKKQN